MGYRDISNRLDVPESLVRTIIADAGIKPPAGRRGVPIPVDTDAAARMYLEEQKSVQEVADAMSVSRARMLRALTDAGTPMRSRSEAGQLKISRLTDEERWNMSRGVREASKGRVYTDKDKEHIAKGREGVTSSNYSRAHQALEKTLRKEGLNPLPRAAVGIYNAGIGVQHVNVEITTRSIRQIHLDDARTRYFLDHGWDVLYVCVRNTAVPFSAPAARLIVQVIRDRAAVTDRKPAYLVWSRAEVLAETGHACDLTEHGGQG